MPVALGNVSNQIFDAVEPMVRNRQIDAQLAIARAQIKAQKQAQLLNLGKDLFNQFNQNYQQDKQLAQQAALRQQELQLRADQQRESYLEQQFNANERQRNAMLEQAQKAGFGFDPKDQPQLDALNQKMKAIDLAVAKGVLTPAEALSEKLAVQRDMAVFRPTQRLITPAQQLNQNAIYEDENGDLFSKSDPGNENRQGTRVGFVGPDGKLIPTPKNTEAQQQAEHVLKMRDEARKIADQAMQEGRDWRTTAEEIKRATGGLVDRTNEPEPVNWRKGSTSAFTPQQINAAKERFYREEQSSRDRLGVDRNGKKTGGVLDNEQQAVHDAHMAPLRQLIHQMDPADPNFAPRPTAPSPEAIQARTQLRTIQQSLDYVRKNGSIPSPRLTESVKALQDFVAGPTPSDPGLARLQRDIVAVNSTANPQRQLEAARELNQFVENPDVMQSGYAPQGFDQPSRSVSAPPSSSFAPGPQSNAAPPQPPASLMIGGQEATPFQKFVLQGGTLDSGSIESNPVGQQYLSEAQSFGGGVAQAIESFNQDKQAFMQSLPIVRDGQFPEGSDVGVDAAKGVVIGKNGSIDNFVTSGAPKRPRGSGGGGKPGGGMPKLPGPGQGGQKPPSQIGSGRPQDRINNPATGKGKQKGVLDPDNPNPRDGLPSKVLLFVNKDERGQKLRELVNKMPAEQRERIQVVDADWDNPDLAAYFEKHGITKGSALPVLIKGEKKEDGTYQQIFRNETYEDILGQMKDARSLRTMALHPDEYEPLDAIDDRHITFDKYLKQFDEAAKRDPSGDALKGNLDPYREGFPGMRPAERINRDIYQRAYEAYRNAQEAGASPEELRALRNQPIKALPEMTLAKEYERSQRIEARNSIDRAVAEETARVKASISEPKNSANTQKQQSPSSYTRDDLRNDVRGFNTYNAVDSNRVGPQAQQLQRDRIQRIDQWVRSTINNKTASEADKSLANALFGKTKVEPSVSQTDPFNSQVFNAVTGRGNARTVDQQKLIDAANSGVIEKLLSEDKASKVQFSPEQSRLNKLAELSSVREKTAQRLEAAQRTISDLNIQKASGKPLTDSQRDEYRAAKESEKYYQTQLQKLDAEIKQLRSEITKDQAEKSPEASGIQQPSTSSSGVPLPPVVAGVPPMSRSEFTQQAMKSRVPASNGGTRPPGQQEIKDAYDSYLRDTQNANDARAGRPPSFPNQPPRPANVPPQSNIPNQPGIVPASATSSIVQQVARGLSAPFRSAVAPGQRPQVPGAPPRGPDSQAIQNIQRSEQQQKEAARRQQQARDAAIQQGFTTPTAPGMELNPVRRPPNPRGPVAPLRTGQLGQSQLPQILGELEALKQKNKALNGNFTFPYLAGFGSGGEELARNRRTGASNASASTSSPFSYRQYGANQAQQQQFVQPFIYSPNNLNAGPQSQSFGFAPQINPGNNFIIPPSNSGFAGPAPSYSNYALFGPQYQDFGGYAGGIGVPPEPEPVRIDNANGTNIGNYSDFYVPGGYDFQNYDFYFGGETQGYDYGGSIYGGYA